MSIEQDKREFITLCEKMERRLKPEMPGATQLEIVAAIAFALWQVVKGSEYAMSLAPANQHVRAA